MVKFSAPSNKEQAIQSISAMIEKFDITIDDIKDSKKQREKDNKDTAWLNTLLGYLGAAFIFGGLGLLLSMIWGDLGSAARVTISYGSGLCAFILGYVFTRDERYTKLSFPFHFISALLLPFGMFVFLDEYMGGNDTQLAIIIVFGVLALQFALPFLKDKKTSLLFFSHLFFYLSISALMDRLHIPRDIIGLIMGTSLIGFSLYLDKTEHRSISPFWYIIGIGTYLAAISNMMFNLNISSNFIGIVTGFTVMLLGWHFKQKNKDIIAPIFYSLGSLGFLYSLFGAVENIAFLDLTFLAASVSMMVISVQIRSNVILIISTLSILSFLGYFTNVYFADITGWPIALIVMGFLLIGISAQAIKLGQKIKKAS